MTSAMAQTDHLMLPTADDTMELSSEVDRTEDIDFDVEGDWAQNLEDDDQMLEDVKSDIGHAADEAMVDEAALMQVSNTPAMQDADYGFELHSEVQETHEMVDDPAVDDSTQLAAIQQQQDDELLDFSDAEEQETGAQAEMTTKVQSTANDAGPELADAHGHQEKPAASDATGAGKTSETQRSSEAVPSIVQPSSPDTGNAANVTEAAPPPDPIEDPSAAPSVYEEEQHNTVEEHHSDTGAQTQSQAVSAGGKEYDAQGDSPSATEHQSTAEDEAIPEIGTPTVTGLHPTQISYSGQDIPLFPSSDPLSNGQYMLQDENLASSSLADLLQALRAVLGGEIGEEDETRLRVDDLGLEVGEDETAAYSTSFAEVLDIYVQLQRQDQYEQVPPLHVRLSTRPRFAHRLSLLTQAVSDGKGLSEVPPPSYGRAQHSAYQGTTGTDGGEYSAVDAHEETFYTTYEPENDSDSDDEEASERHSGGKTKAKGETSSEGRENEEEQEEDQDDESEEQADDSLQQGQTASEDASETLAGSTTADDQNDQHTGDTDANEEDEEDGEGPSSFDNGEFDGATAELDFNSYESEPLMPEQNAFSDLIEGHDDMHGDLLEPDAFGDGAFAASERIEMPDEGGKDPSDQQVQPDDDTLGHEWLNESVQSNTFTVPDDDEDDLDEINFDEEDTTTAQTRRDPSPGSKRTFSQHDDGDGDTTAQDSKKHRPA